MSETTTAGDRCRGVLVGLAENLLDCGGFNAADILNRFLAWRCDGAFDTGPASGRALALMAAGMHAGNGFGEMVHHE